MLIKIIRAGIYTLLYDKSRQHYLIIGKGYPVSMARWKTQSAALAFFKRLIGLSKKGVRYERN